MHARCSAYIVWAALFLLGAPEPASAGAAAGDGRMVDSGPKASSFWMHGGVESWSGDITYRIGFPVTEATGESYAGYFPFSELEFPLDVVFGTVKAGAVLGGRFVVNAQVKKDITDPDDDMIDRDWLSPSYPWRLDIYSKSEVTDFSALVVDGDLSYKVLDRNNMWLAVGAGYMYQDFEYETALLHQWSPSGLSGYNVVGDGRTTLIYEVDCAMPYLLVSGRFDILPELNINARVAMAPWVLVDDRDQHLLRNKESVGDLDGSAMMLSIDAQYDFTPQMFMAAGISHTYIDVDGEMAASFNGVYDYTVAEELTSRQTSAFATIGFRFGVPVGR